MNKSSKKKSLKLLLIALGFVLAYIIIKHSFSEHFLFDHFKNFYTRVIAFTLGIFDSNVYYNNTIGNMVYKHKVVVTNNALALKYYIITGFILFTFARKIKKTILVFIAACIGLFIATTLKFANDIYTSKQFIGFLFWVIVSIRYLIIYFVLKYKINQHSYSKSIFEKISTEILSIFRLNLHQLMIIIALVPAIAGFFDWFLIGKWVSFVDALSMIIMTASDGMLSAIGYPEAYVTDKIIHLGNYWLVLGTNCLGVGLMIVFSSLIFIIKSPLINRILYIILGLIFIILLNAARIDAILLHIFVHQTPQHLIEDYHDLSNNVYYVLVFVIILIYIKWFQHLQIIKKRM